MPEVPHEISNMTVGGIVPTGLLLVVGILLWGAGRRVLKPGLVVGGLLVGAGAGWILGTEVDVGISPWIPCVILGVTLASLATLTYRLAIALSLAGVLGVAAPLGVISIAEMQGRYDATAALESLEEDVTTDERIPDEFTEWLRDDDEAPAPMAASNTEETADSDSGGGLNAATAVYRIQSVSSAVVDAVTTWWAGTPEDLQPQLMLSAIVGTILGILLGALAPNACTAVVTSFGGAMLWLGAARVLAAAIGIADGPLVPASGRIWLIVWAVASALGLGIQWMLRPKEADKAA